MLWSHDLMTLSLCAFALFYFGSTSVFASDDFAWMEARARVQHLRSMQDSNFGQSAHSGKKPESSNKIGALDCALRRDLLQKERKICLGYIAEASKQKPAAIEVSRLLIAIESLKDSKSVFSWQESIALAGAAANLGDLAMARSILKRAREKAEKELPAWVSQRIALFGLLVEIQAEKFPDARQDLYTKEIENFRDDPLFGEVRKRFDPHLVKAKNAKSDSVESSTAMILQDLSYKLWQVAQDRDELAAVSQMFEKSDPEILDFYRLDQLVRRYDSSNREWKAIINLISDLTTGPELLMRGGALQMMMENWLANAVPQGLQMESDQDRTLQRSRMILYEFSAVLRRLIFAVKSDKSFALVRENLDALEERMAATPSPLAVAFNDGMFERDLQAAHVAQSRLVQVEKRLRRAQALLAGYYFFSSLDATEARNLANIRSELRELEIQKRAVIFELFKVLVVLQPNVQKEFRSLIRLNAQTKKSLKDLRTLLSGLDLGNRNQSAAVVQFLDEADVLVERIESSSYRTMAERRVRGERLVKAIEPLQQDVQKIQDEMGKILRSSAAELKPMLRGMIKVVDANLIAKSREIELKMSVAQSALQDDLGKRLDSARDTKDRLEILRRMRSENLQWRVAQ
jgi:hypothetical protein